MFDLLRKVSVNQEPGTLVLVSSGDGVVVPGEHSLLRVARTKYFYTAVVDIAGKEVRIHIDAVRLAPLFWCEGKPVYKGDKLWVDNDFETIVYSVGAIGVFNEPTPENGRGVGRGHSPIGMFTWTRSGAAKTSAPDAKADMFINVYKSVPHGTKMIPGTVIFGSVDAAKKAKHSTAPIGIFKLSEV